MLGFLVMIVLGFTVPGFIQNNNSVAEYVEPRLCQTDSDCYLTCFGEPQAVLCLQNLCLRNSCTEIEYYPLQQQLLTFTLEVNIEGAQQQLTGNSQDIFITLADNQVSLFSPGLNLNHILDKVSMAMNTQCIQVSGTNYCSDGEKRLTLTINGADSQQFTGYIPKQNDVVEIEYG